MYLYVPRMVFTSNEIRIKDAFLPPQVKSMVGSQNQESQHFHVIFLNSAYNSFAYNQVNPTFGFIN